MLVGDAAQRQLVDFQIARPITEHCLFRRGTHSGVNAARDLRRDLSLDLMNVSCCGREALSPSDAVIAGIDELNINIERAGRALDRAFDQVTRT